LLAVAALTACSFEHGRLSQGSDGRVPDGLLSDGRTPGDGSTSSDAAVDAKPNVVTCPGSMCGDICCEGSCVSAGTTLCTGTTYHCDGPEDCTGSEVCCNNKNGSFCTTQTCNGNGQFEVCHTGSDCSFNCGDCSFRSDYGQKVCCE
jgi:hypothetical protein